MVWEFERDRSVLLVIDMQNDFVLEGAILEVSDAREQIPRIRKLIDRCHALGVPIIYTMQETDPVLCKLEVAAFPPLMETGMRNGTHGYQIIDELTPQPEDIIVRKRRFSAFYQTDLELILRNIRNPAYPVDTVIICGTMTNICCESTARDAFFRDFKVVFGTDVCAARTKESQAATLVNMELFGRNMDCESILAALDNGKG
ncbi:MAG: cysteine hydrolase [Oscillospiraceae bacterium]|nr:cysteine hydrolase [Oscillospiraceae bacterium]